MKMKAKTLLLTFIWLSMVSCSTKVDLYTGFKDATIVYGVLDVAQDTSFIKITRAFSGSNDESFDAFEIAQIADSLNYPGKLDARFIELKSVQGNSYAPTGREIILDTITIHNKQEGTFYSPNQKLYYTTARLKVNSGSEKYRYRLTVNKSTDTITSEIGLLGGSNFQIRTEMVKFTSENSTKKGKIYFTPDDNGGIYQVNLQFNYKEVHVGQNPVIRNVSWTLGSFSLMDLGYENGAYFVTYPENALFTELSNAIGNDIYQVERFFISFDISISAYGKELYNYAQMNVPSVNGLLQSLSDYSYTNIEGGYGVFSSRYVLSKSVKMSSRTQADLMGMPWGFKNLGY